MKISTPKTEKDVRKRIRFFCVIVLVFTIVLMCFSKREAKIIKDFKPFVAYKTASYQLYDYFQNAKCDTSAFNRLFYANQDVEISDSIDTGIRDSKANLNDLKKSVYDSLSSTIRYEYESILENCTMGNVSFASDETIIEIVLNDFIKRNIKNRESDQAMVYWVHPYFYNVNRIFDNKTDSKMFEAISEMCGKFSEFRKFAFKSVSVHSSSLIQKQDRYKIYRVIFHVTFGDFDKYALCEIFKNKKDKDKNKIEFVAESECVIDLMSEKAVGQKHLNNILPHW